MSVLPIVQYFIEYQQLSVFKVFSYLSPFQNGVVEDKTWQYMILAESCESTVVGVGVRAKHGEKTRGFGHQFFRVLQDLFYIYFAKFTNIFWEF